MTREKRVIMAKRVARRWIRRQSSAQYRFTIFHGPRDFKQISGLLRSQRDGRIAMQNVPLISDMGVKQNFDSITVWSSKREGMLKLNEWFEKRGYETTGVW